MSKSNFQHVLVLKLYEVLYQESNEEHGLSLAEMREAHGFRIEGPEPHVNTCASLMDHYEI